jgi:hypothetical protein
MAPHRGPCAPSGPQRNGNRTVDTGDKDRGRHGALCVESTVPWRRSTVMHGDGATVHGARDANGEGTVHSGHHRGAGSGTPTSNP